MNYCVQCGANLGGNRFCTQCGADKAALGSLQRSSELASRSFVYPGERQALLFSSILFVALCGFFGVITFGLFLAVIALAFIQASVMVWNKRQTSVRVSSSVFPEIYSLVKSAAGRLTCAEPECFIEQEGNANAYAVSSVRSGCVVLTSTLVDMMTPEELSFVIGHEVGHISSGHTRIINLLSPSRGGVFTGLVGPVVRLFFNVWSVKAEHTADRAGLLVSRNVNAAVSALMKVSVGAKCAAKLSRTDYLSNSEDKLVDSLSEYLGTHPGLKSRIKQLVQFAGSEQYRNMSAGALQHCER